MSFIAPQPCSSSEDTGATLNDGVETAVSNVAVLVLPANPNRKKLIVQNTGTENVRIGAIGVTATTGLRLLPSGSMIIDMPDVPTNAIYAIRESADTIVFAQDIS